VKLFISYPSDQRDLAEHLRLALEEEDHTVFTDRAELKEGEAYHEALREAIADADAMVFLITPKSVAPGSYALTELDLAQRQWRSAGGRVLPVLVAPTPIATIPPYLRSVTLLQPKGDPVAETVAAVARLRGDSHLGRWLGVGALLLALAGGAAWWWHAEQTERARLAALQALLQAELSAARELCSVGSHAVAWDQFTLVTARFPDDPALRSAREDCGMQWLRGMRVRSDKETFSELVAKVQPVLAQGLARASGERRADLRAHLGWADFLRSRDGVAAPDPVPQYRAALQDDAGNVHAHAMWAHHIGWHSDRLDEMATHYAAAARAPRERAWVRGLQFASAFHRRAFYAYALVAANDMRTQEEPLEPAQRERLWRSLVDGPMLNAMERRDLLAALPPDALIATFEWCFPAAGLPEERRTLWRYARALLASNAGERDSARDALEALQKELAVRREDSRTSRAVRDLLAELRRPG
jgi:hypothetical protein